MDSDSVYGRLPRGVHVTARGVTYPDDAAEAWLNHGVPWRVVRHHVQAGGALTRGAVHLDDGGRHLGLPEASIDLIEVSGVWTGDDIDVHSWRPVVREPDGPPIGDRVDSGTRNSVYDSIPHALDDEIIATGATRE
ncbi:hypothetical protein MM440_10200 [Arsenicicoccus piscis]|uniref:Uncharacterized protein n=1 Tax=Arsenicicoccus piscis TaxID=673954 RepID=A0ABQ6HS28_9MICO|nr:hypothetical protein [Arsenicicoccus piscis]MCH8628137.1 hypothetical protein [Arsenicicoccus piscis]GMA20483.1 hypothetical protein GCM10025862_25040 [Arsenicicoccus piscis]